MPSRRDLGAVVGAVLGHVAALLWLTRGVVPRPVTIDEPEPPSLSLDTERPPSASESPPASRFGAQHGARAPLRPIETARTIGTKSRFDEPEPPPAASATDSFSFNPTSLSELSNETLGLGRRNSFLAGSPNGVDDQSRATEWDHNAAPGVEPSLRDGLQARDHVLGLDEGGPLVPIAEELMRPGDTPLNGHAVFDVTIDGNGEVDTVRVIDASEAWPTWEKLASQMSVAMRSRRIALRRGGRGLVVTLEVSSRWVLPSGSRPGRPVSEPFMKVDLGAFSHSRCPMRTPIAAGAHFDVIDIGARPIRDVHAHIIGETRL